MTPEEISGLTFALCEATACGLEFDETRRILATTLAVLWLPPDGPQPDDLRLQFCFMPVSRLAVSLRRGVWNDDTAPTIPLNMSDLEGLVEGFGCNIYGNELFDVHEKELKQWGDRIGLNWTHDGADGRTHSFLLFQEGGTRHLDVLVWFDEVRIFRPDYSEVSVEWVVDGARRWWTAWQQDDHRTDGQGIIRLSNPGDE